METRITTQEDDNEPTWFPIRLRTFFNWCNTHLSKREMKITNIQDFSNGVLLINLLELITGKSLGTYNKNPKIRIQRLENASIATNFLKSEGFSLVGIGAEDIVDIKAGLICGLIWMLIVRYHKQKYLAHLTVKPSLLSWTQAQIPEYKIQNFSTDFRSGVALCALVNSIVPNSIDVSSFTDEQSSLNHAKAAIAAGERLGFPTILSPEDIISPHIEELSVMTYVAYFRNYTFQKLNGDL